MMYFTLRLFNDLLIYKISFDLTVVGFFDCFLQTERIRVTKLNMNQSL